MKSDTELELEQYIISRMEFIWTAARGGGNVDMARGWLIGLSDMAQDINVRAELRELITILAGDIA